MDDLGERLGALEVEVGKLVKILEANPPNVFAWRLKMVEVIAYGFVGAIVATFLTLMVSGVYGERRTSERLLLPTIPYERRGP